MFWTIRIPNESVAVDLAHATASMKLTDQNVKDYHDIANSLKGGPSVPADVSFDIRWHGVQKRFHLRDPKKHFVGDYIQDQATIQWTAQRKGFTFVSDPASTSFTKFAEIGHESNGVFFS